MQLFILNRTNERQTKSVGRILLYALLFFIVTRIAVMLMLTGCTAIYMANTGINPMQGLSFFGNPSVAAAGMGWWALPYVLLVAPFFEECCFRLGLSFRRWQVAVGLGALTLFFVSRFLAIAGAQHSFWWGLPAGIVVAGLLYGFTTDAFWQAKKGWLRPMMWCSAGLFALVHLFAMQGLTWFLVPYALLICLMLFFAGSVMGLPAGQPGFLVGVGAHALNNVPAVFMITLVLMQSNRFFEWKSYGMQPVTPGFRTVARQAEIYPLRICQIYMRRTCRNRSSRGIR